MSYLGIPPFGRTARTVTEVIATAGQTTFYPTGGYTVGYIDVILNGVTLNTSDFTATDGLAVVLSVAASLDDSLHFTSYSVSFVDTQIASQSGNTGKFLSTNGTSTLWAAAQAPLESGTNIKTINSTSVLGSGDIVTGDVTTTGTQTLTNKTLTGFKETKVASSSNTFNLLSANYFTHTISGATTLAVSNTASAGSVNSFIVDLTNGGSATITWWSGMKWALGTAPTLTASGRDILGFFTHDGGTTWNGLVLGKDVK